MNQLKSNENIQQAVPFFMVTSMNNSLNFYIKGLGFDLKNKWEPRGTVEWCRLEIGNASIMLQEYRTTAQTGNPGQGVSVYFVCQDALAFYKQISLRGVVTSEPFVGNNMWVVGLKDPDGYQIFFESPTDVPEETKYSEWTKQR